MFLIPTIYHHLLSLYNMSFMFSLSVHLFPSTHTYALFKWSELFAKIGVAMTLPPPILFPLASPIQVGRCQFLKENAKFELLLEDPLLESITSALAETSLSSSNYLYLWYLFPFSRTSCWKNLDLSRSRCQDRINCVRILIMKGTLGLLSDTKPDAEKRREV